MKFINSDNLNDALSAFRTKCNAAYAAKSHGTHLTLGTGSGNAFRGDYGNTAYTHSQAAHAPSNAQKNSDITKAEIEAKLTGAITSHTHAYAASSHNHTSVNKTMITTPIYNAATGTLVDFNMNEKSGAMVILKLYGNSYSTNPPIEAIYQFYDYSGGNIYNPMGTAISGPAITLKVYRVGGKLKAWFKQPNDYCTFKLEVAYGNNSSTPNVTLSNAAEPTGATETITITPDRVYSAKYKPTASDIGAAASSHGTHVSLASAAPKANGTAAVGTSSKQAREDHVHPLQTTMNGLTFWTGTQEQYDAIATKSATTIYMITE